MTRNRIILEHSAYFNASCFPNVCYGCYNHGEMKLVSDEVQLHRLTADEAVLKLDRYLNDAFMAGLVRVRVIHGKGTGTLRKVVSEQLSKHPLVNSYRLAGYGEGQEGVTIVELARK